MAETDMEMRLRTALAYRARYDQRPTTDPLILLMRQQNEDEIAWLQAVRLTNQQEKETSHDRRP